MTRKRPNAPDVTGDQQEKTLLAVNTLSESVHRLTQAQLEVAHHQRITNLIVLSQIITDPEEQKRLRTEAVSRMNSRRLQ